MAKKPDAARGKTTRIGKIKKIIKAIKDKPSIVGKPGGMSPGAMGGKTKAKFGPRPTKETPGGLRRISENMRRQKLRGMAPMTGAAKSTIKGAGASGTGLSKEAMKLARQLKKTGRLSVDDLMRAKKMIMGRKGK